MTCRQSREALMEWARGAAPGDSARAHVSGCDACARFLEEQRSLSAVLARVADQEIPFAGDVPARLMAEFDTSVRRAKVRVLGWFAAAAVSAAACMALMVTPPKPVPAAVPDTAPVVMGASQFVPIPYTVPLAPEEAATVVRMDIPVSALIAAGYRMPAADPGATIQADVLVSEDGRARAIRAISFVSSN